ncbi:phosphoglycerate dehydrogenase [Polymorphum gilvum]|uniref:D-3-phosphoglycerate dehydrogenase n=1 Tax=Polymorphum gilvum (strain LMG 25793 / CGMCC 1.9160 / SL003B-26A1) TaxID=991905 RepID=F2J2D5_POLGS|nr:phosphoglycerate dehydrogenase [Polymorphum gilvum]ADZ69831.1 D-isomer specific 2-hydroxyacid dehydrogenase, catalytic domain, putative [Polymorphum gilvum SL003B-26A1]
MGHGLSRPKNQIRWLLLEGIAPTARAVLEANGYHNVEMLPKALDRDALIEAIKGVHVVGIRSRTQITEEILAAANTLVAVGCFSVGTNQVDLHAAMERGIPVFNAPFSNTRSVAELTIAEIVMLMRGIFEKSTAAHAGRWMKTAAGSREVRGKTLGIVGYGNIGTQLAMLAEAFGMSVIYYDKTDKLRHGNVVPADTLDELLARADVVSLHVPDTPETRNMIGAEQLAKMKPGSFLINNARGKVIDIDALAAALESGHIAGAAIDVFPSEPKSNADEFVSPLRAFDNVILTPHVGGSTEEAQERIGEEVSRRLVEYSDVGSTLGAVNFPQVQLPKGTDATRFIQVHRNVPGAMRTLNDLFARHNLNIHAQYMQTIEDIGYVVLDVDGQVPNGVDILEEIRALPNTIRARLLNRV